MSRLPAILSVNQLAKLAGVSRQRMHRVLEALDIPSRHVGNKRLIFLTDLKSVAPDLWESICESNRLGEF